MLAHFQSLKGGLCFLIILASFFGASFGRAVYAYEFNPNNIISDGELFNKDSMTLTEIQNFLERYESLLADYSTIDLDGTKKSAAEIIYGAAQRNGVSPKFLLAKLDHEQALIRKHKFISDASWERALKWATGFSACDNCSLNSKYAGFANQVEALASVQHDYIRKFASFGIQVGKPFVTKDGITVTPENNATRNLFIYTPWHGGKDGIGGNSFFGRLWYKYFGKKKYPDGIVLRDSSDVLWLVKDGERRKYVSRASFLANHAIEEAVYVSDKDLNEYPLGPEIKFFNYALIQTPNGQKYLVVDEEIRPMKDDETFRMLGFNPEEVMYVSDSDLAGYDVGYPIGPQALFPASALVKTKDSVDLFFVQDGRKRRIPDESIYKVNFNRQPPVEIEQSLLDTMVEDHPMFFKNGALVKSPAGKSYIISNGMKLPIQSEEDITGLLGKDKLLLFTSVSQASLDLHETGDPIVYINPVAKVSTPPPAVDPSTLYVAVWQATKAPKTVLEGTVSEFSISFLNAGASQWKKGDVRLKITDSKGNKLPLKGSDWQDDFGNIQLARDVPPSEIYEFKFTLAGSAVGKHVLRVQLEYGDQNMRGGGIELNVEVVPADYSARIVSDNFKIAVRNKWNVIPAKMTIKNTGKKAWTRKKTGLQVLAISGGGSDFYDAHDWVSKDIAAVSLKPRTELIQPGAEAVYEFTMKVKDLRPGVYTYVLQLVMKDKNGQVIFLNEQTSLSKQIRIDN